MNYQSSTRDSAGLVFPSSSYSPRFVSVFMDSVSSSLDELEAALAAGEDERLAELGSRLKACAKIASSLGLTALCQSLTHMQMRATLSQVCELV